MRSSCSESTRLRSARSVCSARRPEICRVRYHDTPTTAASVTTSPSSSAGAGERLSIEDLCRGDYLRRVTLRVFRRMEQKAKHCRGQAPSSHLASVVQRAERRPPHVLERAIDRRLGLAHQRRRRFAGLPILGGEIFVLRRTELFPRS